MKKYKLLINILLIFVFVASIIALALIIQQTHNHWYVFNEFLADWKDNPEHDNYLNATLCLTFSVIFSALSAIASAIACILLNFKVWKEPKHSEN